MHRKNSRAVYTRKQGGQFYRLAYPHDAFIDAALEHGKIDGLPIAYIQWAHGNYDFELKRPRATPPSTNLTELFYRAEWENRGTNLTEPE